MRKPGKNMLWLMFALGSAGACEATLNGATGGQTGTSPPTHRTVVTGTTDQLQSTPTRASKGHDLEWRLQDIDSDFWIHFLRGTPCSDANGQTNYLQGNKTRPARCSVSTDLKGSYPYNIIVPDVVRHTRSRAKKGKTAIILDQVKNCIGCVIVVQ